MRKIFIVEDDSKIATLLRDYFKQADFDVSLFRRGDTVVRETEINHPDIILLDLMLPGKDGLTICREIRSFSDVPIVIITARVDEIDRVIGLELGADDYICKPFSPKEVIARVKAILRRKSSDPAEEMLVAGPIKLSPFGHMAIIGDTELRLTPNEFELLKVLMSKPGYIFTRSDLIVSLHGYHLGGYDRIIDSHIKNIRKKIDELLPGNNIVQTIYGIGYSLAIPLSIDNA